MNVLIYPMFCPGHYYKGAKFSELVLIGKGQSETLLLCTEVTDSSSCSYDVDSSFLCIVLYYLPI